MTPEVGRIEKPEAEAYRSKRKLFLVPLIIFSEKTDPELVEKCRAYWKEVKEQITNLEAKIGVIQRIYHESIIDSGPEGLATIQEFNPDGFELASSRAKAGASFELIEDRDLAEESMDWERCLMMGFISEKVASRVSDFYAEASRKRYEHIAKRIDETLKGEETGILFIKEGHRIQFPKDIEVFIIFPPTLDAIHRWLREQAEKRRKASPDQEPPKTE
jgi:hypothetical protein